MMTEGDRIDHWDDIGDMKLNYSDGPTRAIIVVGGALFAALLDLIDVLQSPRGTEDTSRDIITALQQEVESQADRISSLLSRLAAADGSRSTT